MLLYTLPFMLLILEAQRGSACLTPRPPGDCYREILWGKDNDISLEIKPHTNHY